MPPRTPTASAISRLLSAAGFERAVISIRGGNSGFKVEKCRSRDDAVKVRQYFCLSGQPDERYRKMLVRYATAIEAAGYRIEAKGTYHLVVTAPPSRLSVITAAEEG